MRDTRQIADPARRIELGCDAALCCTVLQVQSLRSGGLLGLSDRELDELRAPRVI